VSKIFNAGEFKKNALKISPQKALM